MCNNIYITHHHGGHYCGVTARAVNINTVGEEALSEYFQKWLVGNIMFISEFMSLHNQFSLSIVHKHA